MLIKEERQLRAFLLCLFAPTKDRDDVQAALQPGQHHRLCLTRRRTTFTFRISYPRFRAVGGKNFDGYVVVGCYVIVGLESLPV